MKRKHAVKVKHKQNKSFKASGYSEDGAVLDEDEVLVNGRVKKIVFA